MARWEPAGQAARRLLAAMAICAALALGGAQPLLWTPLLREAINSRTQNFQVDYRWAWSAWPGRVHLRGLRIRGQDMATQWLLRVDEVVADISLREALHKTFHASRVRPTRLPR